MTWSRLKNWLKWRPALPIRQAETPDPYHAERIRLQEQVSVLQAQMTKAWEMVRLANENERLAYQSMCNTLGRSQFAKPPFPNAGFPPDRVDDSMVMESGIINGSDEVERLARVARAEARVSAREFFKRTHGN